MLRYKACRKSIVTLELLDDSINNEKRNGVVDDKYSKFRCDKAKVISITEVKTGEKMEKDVSIFHHKFEYRVGKIVKTDFDEDINKVCARGIHYFKTEEAALSWFYREYSCPDGKHMRWHENGWKQSEETFKNGEMDGNWIGWWKNGTKRSEGIYKNGIYDGKWIYWWSNGNKKSESTYKDGKKDGKWTYWLETGQKVSEGTYKDEDGNWIYWYTNGNKKSEGTDKDAKKDGKWIQWYENGQKQSEETYEDGILIYMKRLYKDN